VQIAVLLEIGAAAGALGFHVGVFVPLVAWAINEPLRVTECATWVSVGRI